MSNIILASNSAFTPTMCDTLLHIQRMPAAPDGFSPVEFRKSDLTPTMYAAQVL